MSRIQVYLPDDLYRVVKEKGLPVSALLQKAVREELERLRLLQARDEYLIELVDELGEPVPDGFEHVKEFVENLKRRQRDGATV